MRILVVKQSSLGDLFHALPSVHALKAHFGADIDWVVNEEYVPLVECFTDVARVLPFPRRNMTRHARRFVRELRREPYDLAVDFQGLMKSALVVRAARASRRLGPSHVREGASVLYTETAPGSDAVRHAVDVALDIPRHLGVPIESVEFPVRFPPPEIHEPSPRIAFVPCSRWAAKNWVPERFSALGRALMERVEGSLYLCGAPANHEICEGIADAVDSDRCHNLAGATSLVGLGSLLSAMDLVVTVDSGPMHMAAALGVPVLALFGATDPRRTGPFGPRHRVLLAPALENDPDLARAFKRSRSASAWDMPVEQVLEAAVSMLSP